MKKLLMFTLAALLAAFLGCSENALDEGDNGNGVTDADSAAVYWFQALADTLHNIGDALDPGEGEPDFDYVKQVRFDEIRDGFDDVLAAHTGHGLSHLGLGLVDFCELNYDEDLWEIVDQLYAMGGGGEGRINPFRNRLIGRQLLILAEAPYMLAQQTREFPANLTVPYLQELIIESILPPLASAIGHVESAEADADFGAVVTIVDGGGVEHEMEIDRGELYFFDGMLRALRAGLRIMTAYNLDIEGPDGTYDWLELLEDDYGVSFQIAPGDASGDTLRVYRVWNNTTEMLVFEMLQYQSVPGSEFLTLRTDPYSGETQLGLASVDLAVMLGKMEDAVDFIEAEGDPQDDDIIKIGDIDELNADIDDCEDCPSFIEEMETIHDLIAWIEEVISGPYFIDEMIDGQQVTLTVDLSVLFNDPIQDWKTKLPYYQWLPHEQWHHEELIGYGAFPNDPAWPYYYYDWEDSDYNAVFENIGWVEVFEWNQTVEPAELTDPQGVPIDPEFVMPHFQDYEMGGLFPGMTRADWEAIFGY